MESPVLRIEVSSTSLRMELSMSDTATVSPLRQRMIEDMGELWVNLGDDGLREAAYRGG